MPVRCCVWDFTLSCEHGTKEDVDTFCRKWCKKWCYQMEKSDGEYLHWQGRVSLKVKSYLKGIVKKLPKAHWSPTSSENRDNDFYTCKEDTRVDGPWKDSDPYMPRQIRMYPNMLPWQQSVIDLCKVWDPRRVHVILDTTGNIGKTTLVGYMRCNGLARKLPMVNDMKDLLRAVCDMPTSTAYLIDMPRCTNKERLFQLWSAVEEIKNGYAYDDRYHFKEKFFDSPAVIVFTNTMPDLNLLSKDRWVIHTIVDGELH